MLDATINHDELIWQP